MTGCAQDTDYVYVAGSAIEAGPINTVAAARFSKSHAKMDQQWPSAAVAAAPLWGKVAVENGLAYFVGPAMLVGVATGPENPMGEVSFTNSLAPNEFGPITASRGSIFLQGLFYSAHRFARFDGSGGGLDESFQPKIYNNADVSQVIRSPNGVTFVSGDFDTIGDLPTSDLDSRTVARFEPDGSFDTSWVPPPHPDAINKIFVFGDSLYLRTLAGGLIKASVATPCGVDETWNPRAKLDASLPVDQQSQIVSAEFGGDSVFLFTLGGKTLGTMQ